MKTALNTKIHVTAETSLKLLTLTEQCVGLYLGGLISGRIIASVIWGGLIFGRAYYRKDICILFSGGLTVFTMAYYRNFTVDLFYFLHFCGTIFVSFQVT